VSSVLSSIEGGAVGGATAIAVGAGLEPLIEPGKQEIWANNAFRVLEAGILARLVAQGLVEFDPAAAQAERSGYDANKFRGMVELEKAGPPVAEALTLRRRDRITAAQFEHALSKAQVEPQYWPALKELVDERLDPPVIALAIVRGIINDPGFLPVGPPTTEGKVKAFPVSTVDALNEAASSGYNRERLFVETAIAGRPMSPESAASAVFRSIIEKVDYQRAIAEGDLRNEWAEAIFDTARQILTANNYAELQLRGFLTLDERRLQTDKHGMSHADSDLLYDLLGRSIPVHQITTGLARGGVFEAPSTGIPKSYLQSLQRGNLRPEYYDLAYANRYTMPSAFVIRALLTGGAITAAQGETLFLESGWKPSLAKQVAEFYGKPTTGGAGSYVTKADTQLWNTTHRTFVARESGVTQARANFAILGIARAEQDEIITRWQAERDLTRKQLTPAQIKKAYAKVVKNEATGQPWTLDDAISALVNQGYSVEGATQYLDIPPTR
jgi:hypothetical protein